MIQHNDTHHMTLSITAKSVMRSSFIISIIMPLRVLKLGIMTLSIMAITKITLILEHSAECHHHSGSQYKIFNEV